MGLQRLDVAPVLGELRLELGNALLALGDLRFEPLQLRRALRLGARRLRLGALRLLRLRRLGELLAAADVVRPAAVVARDRPVLERESAVGDSVDRSEEHTSE